MALLIIVETSHTLSSPLSLPVALSKAKTAGTDIRQLSQDDNRTIVVVIIDNSATGHDDNSNRRIGRNSSNHFRQSIIDDVVEDSGDEQIKQRLHQRQGFCTRT